MPSDAIAVIWLGNPSLSNFEDTRGEFWGHKTSAGDLNALAPGMPIVFAHGFENATYGNNPRSPLSTWRESEVEDIVVGSLVSGAFRGTTPLWADEVTAGEIIYPHRYQWTHARDASRLDLSIEPIAVVEALRGSCLGRGKPVVIDRPTEGALAAELERLDSEQDGDVGSGAIEGGWTETTTHARLGQSRFRAALSERQGGICAVTGTAVDSVLEAAHVDGYDGSHEPSRGLLLRTDIHHLMDAGLLTFDIVDDVPKALLHPALRTDSEYGRFHGMPLRLPLESLCSVDVLREHGQRTRASW